MDPLSKFSAVSPTYLDLPLSAAQAQQLLQRVGWTYYTIWKTDSTQNPLSNAPGLAWSAGDVNRSLLAGHNNLDESITMLITRGSDRADSHQQIVKACRMGYILQQFYETCSFLPRGLGIAGISMASGRYRWAFGEELIKQISLLSTGNRQNVPSDLKGNFFETVVCIPLQNGAGVLEMGTTALVPEGTDGILSKMLGFIEGLATGTHILREEKMFNSAVNYSGCGLIPCKAGQYQCGEPEEHNNTLKGMQIYGGRAYIRQSSISSSYCSSSSPASSPQLSADHQKASSSITLTSLQSSSNQLDILNQLGHVEVHAAAGSSTAISTIRPALCNQQLTTNADQRGASHASKDQYTYSSHPALHFSVTNVTTFPPLYSLPEHDTQYDQQHFCRDNLHGSNRQQLQQYWDKRAICSADHHVYIQHYAGCRSAAEAPSRCGAFKSWSRSSFKVSFKRNQKKAARDSLLKKLLIFYLPTHRGPEVRIDRAIRRGSSGPLMQNIGGGRRGLVLQAKELIVQLDDPSSMTANESTQNEAAMNHVHAERIRRSKQAECYKALRNLVPNTAKKDKVGTLEHSIQYLKELKGNVCELEKAKDALVYMNVEDNKDAMRNLGQHTSSYAIGRCLCIPPSIYKDGTYFQLNVRKTIKHKEANMTNIEILSALLNKNMHCIKLSSEFQKKTRKLDIDILAKYKDVDNCTLSLDMIREIEEWWPKFIEDL